MSASTSIHNTLHTHAHLPDSQARDALHRWLPRRHELVALEASVPIIPQSPAVGACSPPPGVGWTVALVGHGHAHEWEQAWGEDPPLAATCLSVHESRQLQLLPAALDWTLRQQCISRGTGATPRENVFVGRKELLASLDSHLARAVAGRRPLQRQMMMKVQQFDRLSSSQDLFQALPEASVGVETPTPVLVVHGSSGCGKTALLAEWLQHVHKKRPSGLTILSHLLSSIDIVFGKGGREKWVEVPREKESAFTLE